MSNLASIYNTPDYWYTATTYNLWDVVTQNGFIYYCSQNHVSNVFATDLTNGKWTGRVTFNGQNCPLFAWKPSYGSPVKSEPQIRSIRFSDGYEQRSPGQINNNLIKIDFQFNLRSDNETLAIVHFLASRAGTESFIFTPPKPFNMQKRFISKTYSENFEFFDNHSIQANFEETAN